MATCRLCFKDIAFSSEPQYISVTGKMIPLDVNPAGIITGKHQCQVWRQMNRRYYKCRKCSREIYFDEYQKSKNGRPIPLDRKTGFGHQCNN
jgi:hypothetical protein